MGKSTLKSSFRLWRIPPSYEFVVVVCGSSSSPQARAVLPLSSPLGGPWIVAIKRKGRRKMNTLCAKWARHHFTLRTSPKMRKTFSKNSWSVWGKECWAFFLPEDSFWDGAAIMDFKERGVFLKFPHVPIIPDFTGREFAKNSFCVENRCLPQKRDHRKKLRILSL